MSILAHVRIICFYVVYISVIFHAGRKDNLPPMSLESLVEPDWLRTLSESQPKAAELLAKSPEEQRRLGYFHTLREICQQPSTWIRTSD